MKVITNYIPHMICVVPRHRESANKNIKVVISRYLIVLAKCTVSENSYKLMNDVSGTH